MALLRKFVRKFRTLYSDADERTRWRKWLRSESLAMARDRRLAPAAIEAFTQKPLISVIVPVYNIEERFLRKCIQSVLNQWYPHLELCIADDRSPAPHVKRVLEEFAQQDRRVKLVFRNINGGISEASNSALAVATGEFCALLDHDDELSEDALFRVAAEINRSLHVDLMYSDEDKIDREGNRFDPTFKPDWSRDLFYSLNLLNHLTVYRTDVMRTVGAFRSGFEGSQDYDLALRILELIPEENITHISRVLYHWRTVPGSVALSGSEKSYAHDRARAALTEHFARMAIAAKVEPAANNWHRVRYRINEPVEASVLVYGQTAQAVEESAEKLQRLTSPRNVEFTRIVCPADKLAAALNESGLRSKAAVLCFIAAGLTPLAEGWLDELHSLASHKPIGAVGAKLFRADETVIGSGVITGVGRGTAAAHYGLPRNLGGNVGRNVVIGNYSAVSVLCMATRRQHFETLGGFDSSNLPSALFDVDYCLRLKEIGYRVVFTPYAELISPDEIPAFNDPQQGESESFRSRWGAKMENDPFYNPNFSKADGRFRIKA